MSDFHAATFIGVISPSGKIEAVEITEDSARLSAANLSPDRKHPNRTVEPVTVFRGSLERLFDTVALEAILDAVKRRMHAKDRDRIEELRQTLSAGASANPKPSL